MGALPIRGRRHFQHKMRDLCCGYDLTANAQLGGFSGFLSPIYLTGAKFLVRILLSRPYAVEESRTPLGIADVRDPRPWIQK